MRRLKACEAVLDTALSLIAYLHTIRGIVAIPRVFALWVTHTGTALNKFSVIGKLE